MPEPEPALAIEGLTAGYTDQPVVRDFSTRIERGSITTVIGPNGAGKSTLLKSIYGIGRLFGGRILFDGEPIQHLAPPARLQRGVGFVPQGRCNFPMMSVQENLELGAYTLPRATVTGAIERMLVIFPLLRTKWHVLAGNLSGGEQQILEMAMVLATAPRLLLLDEPSLGLSPANLNQVFRTIHDIRDQGVTVLMVEQNAVAALRISDIGIVMELGRKSLEGAAGSILGNAAVHAAYLGAVAT
jgi:branched-chain amino acid transport system ATP-binding protein